MKKKTRRRITSVTPAPPPPRPLTIHDLETLHTLIREQYLLLASYISDVRDLRSMLRDLGPLNDKLVILLRHIDLFLPRPLPPRDQP